MKKTFLLPLIFLVPLFVNAETASKEAICNMLGNKAELVMLKRQQEYPLSQALSDQDNSKLSSTFKKIVMMAYEEPAFRTKENKDLSIKKFRNKVEIMCFKQT